MIPRRLSARTTGLALLASWTWLASPAAAMPSVDLYFTELNGSTIGDTRNLAVRPGDQLGVEMRISSDDRGVYAYSLSVDFDSAGTNRLVLGDFATLLAPGFETILGPGPQGPEDALGAPGMVRLFAASAPIAQPNPLSANATFTVATLEFSVTDEILNGPAAIAPGLFFEGVDEIASNEFELVGGEFQFVPIGADFTFNSATIRVTVVPEPGTALLLTGGLLVLARLRPRR